MILCISITLCRNCYYLSKKSVIIKWIITDFFEAFSTSCVDFTIHDVELSLDTKHSFQAFGAKLIVYTTANYFSIYSGILSTTGVGNRLSRKKSFGKGLNSGISKANSVLISQAKA